MFKCHILFCCVPFEICVSGSGHDLQIMGNSYVCVSEWKHCILKASLHPKPVILFRNIDLWYFEEYSQKIILPRFWGAYKAESVLTSIAEVLKVSQALTEQGCASGVDTWWTRDPVPPYSQVFFKTSVDCINLGQVLCWITCLKIIRQLFQKSHQMIAR